MAEEPASSEQRHCKGFTEQNKPCQRVPSAGEEYCWQHKPKPGRQESALPISGKLGFGNVHITGTQIASTLGLIATMVATLVALGWIPTRPTAHAWTLHYVFIVDSSARMASGAGDGTSKWSTIRTSLENHLLAGLPPGASYSLLALGGKAFENTGPCEDIPSHLVVPMKRNNMEKVIAGIDGLEPRGVASLEDALKKAGDELFRLPQDQHKALFLFLGGGDECDTDPWTSLKYFLKDSGPQIDARIEIVILPGENVDETVADAAEITELVNDMALENVVVHTPRNKSELEKTIGQIQEDALENAQKFEPQAVSQHRTALAEVSTPMANLQEEENLEESFLPADEETGTPPAPPNSASLKEPSTPTASLVNVHANTATPTPTSTPVPTFTNTTYLPTNSPTSSPVPVAPAANNPVPTQTSIPTGTPTQTPTPTPTPTLTNTATSTPTLKCPHALPRQFLQGTASYSGQITIESPGDCTTGHPPEYPIETNGTYFGITPGTTIWILVYPENQLYYPQSPNACATPIAPPPTQVANGWSVSTYLGKAGTGPQWFDIVVVLADQEASDYLSSWLLTGCMATPNNFTGIDPDTLKAMNITEVGYITVQTK